MYLLYISPHSLQEYRPKILFVIISRLTSNSRNKSTSVILDKASVWFKVLGKPSNRNPCCCTSSLLNLSATISIVISSGTNAPLSIYSLAFKPKGVSFFKFSRKISPVLMCGISGKTFFI